MLEGVEGSAKVKPEDELLVGVDSLVRRFRARLGGGLSLVVVLGPAVVEAEGTAEVVAAISGAGAGAGPERTGRCGKVKVHGAASPRYSLATCIATS